MKEMHKLVTYESGEVRTVVNYVLARKNDMKDVKYVKVIRVRNVFRNTSWLLWI